MEIDFSFKLWELYYFTFLLKKREWKILFLWKAYNNLSVLFLSKLSYYATDMHNCSSKISTVLWPQYYQPWQQSHIFCCWRCGARRYGGIVCHGQEQGRREIMERIELCVHGQREGSLHNSLVWSTWFSPSKSSQVSIILLGSVWPRSA